MAQSFVIRKGRKQMKNFFNFFFQGVWNLKLWYFEIQKELNIFLKKFFICSLPNGVRNLPWKFHEASTFQSWEISVEAFENPLKRVSGKRAKSKENQYLGTKIGLLTKSFQPFHIICTAFHKLYQKNQYHNQKCPKFLNFVSFRDAPNWPKSWN